MSPLALPERLLLGPGPSNVCDEVRAALARPLVGHLDPAFLSLLDEMQGQLRRVFKSDSAFAFPLSGTGSAGMEACLVNLLEPGETALVAVNGVFGERIATIAERAGAVVRRVEAEMGEAVPVDKLVAGIQARRPALVALVHAETSTGVEQPIAEVASAARAAGALVVVDCVTSLSGID
ncbi:MAG TPA: aminotransferase class V-fold PLP-dependent enzyme, partial [Myxococcota bacterium]|nr:aminotransferase class V-fold PLP-dependent enzyme [Myxococcota bacterium]